MARRFRDRTSSTWIHAYNGGADGQDIFSLRGDHALFESLMGESAIRFGVDIHAYALMTNHFHVLVHVENGSLSEWMRYFCGRYAAAYNSRTSRSGPLFNGRFGSVPIVEDGVSRDRQLIVIGRYIHRNPLAFVRKDLLASYPHSSLGAYCGRRPAPAWLRTDVLSSFPSAAQLTSSLEVHDEYDRLPPPGFDPIVATDTDEVCAAVDAVAAHVDPGLRRVLTMALVIELRAGGVDDLAGRFGIKPESVRRTARRGRVRIDTEPTLQKLRTAVLDQLAA